MLIMTATKMKNYNRAFIECFQSQTSIIRRSRKYYVEVEISSYKTSY